MNITTAQHQLLDIASELQNAETIYDLDDCYADIQSAAERLIQIVHKPEFAAWVENTLDRITDRAERLYRQIA